jgi:D-alanyl-lipoteichoic acid acyltransferase DltB (MBOAT superfamily)
MLFNSIEFAIFFLVIFTIYSLLRRRFRTQNVLLLVGSYFFYGWWDVRFLFLIVLSTAIDYVAGLLIDRGEVTPKKRIAVSAFILISAALFLIPDWAAIDFRLTSLPGLIEGQEFIASSGLLYFLGSCVVVGLLNMLVAFLRKASENTRRKVAVFASVAVNLTILGFFKYYDFFAESFSSAYGQLTGSVPSDFTLGFILPVGISFYTFQTMSYTIDLYRNKTKSTDRFIDFAAYVAFFPQLVAGPIERASKLLPQFGQIRPALTMDIIRSSVWLIGWGLFKKMFVADNMAVIVNATFGPYDDPSGTFAVPQDGLTLLVGVYAFAFQIYGDFSGYTDIARGVARLLGFDLMLNFRLPYFATSPSDFWRRWHISLSTWLRDYLYIPLGGNRAGGFGTYRNLTIVMLLGGLWHGAGWNFVLWGAYHGLLLCAYRALGIRTEQKEISFPRQIFLGLVMFNLTCIGWMLFRAQNIQTIGVFFEGIFTSPVASMQTWLDFKHIFFFGWFLVLFQIGQALTGELDLMKRLHWFIRLNVWIYIIMSIAVFADTSGKEFIYFAF